MKIVGVTALALLLAPAACRVVPSLPRQHTATNITTFIKIIGTPLAVNSDPASGSDSPPPPKRPKLDPGSPTPAEPDQPATLPQSEWDKHVCRGEKLTLASNVGKDKAEAFALPIDTPWTGTLEAERKLWGYTESADPDCDFEGSYYDITRALQDLNIEDGDCFRISHYDPEKEDEIEVKDQTYTVEGKVYRATGAHGTFGVNVKEGAVFFIDVASPPRKAAQVWGVQDPPKDQLPALRQMSDLLWGFWYQAHGGSDLGHITKFIVPQIISETTIRLIDQALQTYEVPDGEERHQTVPEWPGISFDISTAPGKALLGSPIGIAAAYFLFQHKQEIGSNKYVNKITVFRPDEDVGQDEPTIIYYVANASAPSPEDEKPDPNQGRARRDLVFAADTDLWHDCVCRGEKLTQACIVNKDKAAQIAEPIESPWQGTMEAELKLWGYHELPANSHCNFDDIEPALKALQISRKSSAEGGVNYCYQVRHWYENAKNPDGTDISQKDQTYEVDGRKFRMTSAHSIIGANIVSGVIFFVDVRSAYHAAEELWYPEVPTPETMPKLRAISDISWAFWNRAWLRRSSKRRNLGNINYFVVHNIVNDETEKLIKQALEIYDVPEGQQRVTELPKWPGVTFDVESEAGKAMLGSPNGIAAGYFLAQHKAEIGGNKYVHQVQIFAPEWGGGSAMILHVKDAPAPASGGADVTGNRRRSNGLDGRSPMSAVNPSALGSPLAFKDIVTLAGKKIDDATLWQTCRCRGEKLTQASLRNKGTAINFVTAIDSEWDGTMEAELKLWGYREPKEFGFYCEFDNVAAPLKELGVDTRFRRKSKDGQNECYYVLHNRPGDQAAIKKQTYEVEDKTYRMTNAYMHMGINARDGMITYFAVLSAERGAMQTWEVEEPAVADFPKLNRVSDISWAFWKRAHKAGTGLNNINKFLVHDITNEDTLRLIKMALESYKVPEGDSRRTILPKWPGLVFDIDTEEGKVMLGSPNGVAAGYFLVQHKTQLGGNKYIYQVTLWKDGEGDEQMMFWVKDSPSPQATPEEQIGRRMPTPEGDGNAHAFGKAGKVVNRSMDGRNVIREHLVLAKL